MAIIMTTLGFSTGAKPTKLATYLVFEYLLVFSSTFCDVPVFPATLKPEMAAFGAVPSALVTFSSMAVTFLGRLFR